MLKKLKVPSSFILASFIAKAARSFPASTTGKATIILGIINNTCSKLNNRSPPYLHMLRIGMQIYVVVEKFWTEIPRVGCFFSSVSRGAGDLFL